MQIQNKEHSLEEDIHINELEISKLRESGQGEKNQKIPLKEKKLDRKENSKSELSGKNTVFNFRNSKAWQNIKQSSKNKRDKFGKLLIQLTKKVFYD